jgi:hypothetical protein
MRAGSRIVAVLLAAAVWIYAGMTLSSMPMAHQADSPWVLEVAATAAIAVVD